MLGAYLVPILVITFVAIVYTRAKGPRVTYYDDDQSESLIPQELSYLSAKCSNCGAVIPPSIEGKVITHCPYCGNALPDMRKFIEEAAKIRQEQQRHNMKLREIDRDIKKERVRNFPETAKLIRVILKTIVVLFLFIMMYKMIGKMGN